MKEKEEIIVNTRKVKCNGYKGSLGHPLVYLQIEKNDEIICPYCSKKFIYKKINN